MNIHPDRTITPDNVLALQRFAGNAAVARSLEGERHRHDEGCGHAPAVQRSAVHEVLRSGGTPLGGPLRAEMEARLGADFSDVRIHSGLTAQRSAEEIGARAYTSGSHVVIGAGGTDKHTLAHELTHVIQQRKGPVSGTDNGSGLRVSDPGDRFERAAEDNARRVMAGPVPVRNALEAGLAAQGGSSEGAAWKEVEPAVASTVQRRPSGDRRNEHWRKMNDPYRGRPEDEEKPYVIRQISAVNKPYNTDAITRLQEQHAPGSAPFVVDPQRIRTMHAGIADRFADGRSMDSTTEWLKEDPKRARHLPPIGLVATDMRRHKWDSDSEHSSRESSPARLPATGTKDPGLGVKPERRKRLFSSDHRRVIAARNAGITEIPAQFMTEPTVGSKFTTQNNGRSVEVRSYFNREEGAHQGGNRSTFPSSAYVYKGKSAHDGEV
ncbi:eCIS core domain-containing protein [Streptomyces sp. NPDC003393]